MLKWGFRLFCNHQLNKTYSQSKIERASKDWRNCFVASFPTNFNDETEKAKLLLSFLELKGKFLSIKNTRFNP